MPVKVWKHPGLTLCGLGASVDSHGEAKISRSAWIARFRTDVEGSSPQVALVAVQRLALALIAMCSSITATAVEVRPERWRWSDPLPHGNNIFDLFVTSDVAVQVGDGGTVYVQRLDQRWAPAVTGVTSTCAALRGWVTHRSSSARMAAFCGRMMGMCSSRHRFRRRPPIG